MPLIHPYAHKLLLEHQDKPVFMHCVVGDCRICEKVEAAKNLKMVDEIVKRLFGR